MKTITFTFTVYVYALKHAADFFADDEAALRCPGAVVDDVEVSEWRADKCRDGKVLRWAADVRAKARWPG